MNIRELKLFRHLAGTLHFGRTSQACNITPSGLTRAMQRLEQELGQPLLQRNKRSVRLTAAGKIFNSYAEETINRWSELQHQLNDSSVLRGELSIYCSVTAILSILPDIFNRFRYSHPEVNLHLETGDAAQALYKLQRGEADIAVAALPRELPANLVSLELLTTPLIFIAPAGQSATITSAGGEIDWQQTPVILPEHGLSRERVDRWFAARGITPSIYSQVAGNEAIIAMVGMGCGIGIVPRLVLEQSMMQAQVVILEVAPELKPFSVGVCTGRESRRSPLINGFWEIAASLASTSPVKQKMTNTSRQNTT